MPMEMSAKKEEVDFESISSLRGGAERMTCVAQTCGVGMDVPMNDNTWNLFHPVSIESIDRESGNGTFNILWGQAMLASQAKILLDGIGCAGMEVSCTMDNAHSMAIKVVTKAGCKLMIFPDESGMIDPLDVRFVNSRFVQDVVSEYGRITFAPMIEAPNLIQLLHRLEEWTVAFVLVHGCHKAGLPVRESRMIF